MLQQDQHLIGKIDYTVCMFRHGEIHLLPQTRRMIQYRDRTRHGNSAFPFQLMFRIRSCIFSIGMHIGSWSRTRDTTLIRGLNHGWNRTFINLNLSPPYFVTPISNDETREIFAFKNQVDNDSMSISSSEDFTSLDDCIDQSRQTEPFLLLILSEAVNPNDWRQRSLDN